MFVIEVSANDTKKHPQIGYYC